MHPFNSWILLIQVKLIAQFVYVIFFFYTKRTDELNYISYNYVGDFWKLGSLGNKHLNI